MQTAQEWASALNRSNITGTRLFGSKLGEIELKKEKQQVHYLLKVILWLEV